MAQGTVTDYFPKRRKASLVPPSKRSKTVNDLCDKRSGVDSEQIEKTEETNPSQPKFSSKTSSRRSRTRRNKKTEVNNTLSKYFQKVNEPKLDTVSTKEDEHVKETGVEAAKCKDSESDAKKQAKYNFENANLVTETDSCNTTKRGVRRKLPSEEYEDTEDVATSADNANMTDCKLATPSKNIDAVTESGPQDGQMQRKILTISRRNTSSKYCELGNRMEKSKLLAEKLMTKETTESLREKLKSKGDLKSLQESLMKMHQLKKKQKEREIAKKAQKEEKIVETPEKSETKKREFAYETLHSLAQTVPDGLPLPFKWKLLVELFRCMDVVVSMLFNRQQIITWKNLQKSVQEMVRKNFELSHLAQIKSVFPTAYQYRQEKGIISGDEHVKSNEYQLTVEPMFQEEDQFGGEKKLTSGLLGKRRHHFHVQLINIVHDHHKSFLSKLSPPIVVPADKKIRRWHPQFPLDTVPDLDEADLPLPPEKKDKCNSAKDVLEKARSRLTKKAADALRKVAEKSSLTPEKSSICVEKNNNEISKIKAKIPTTSLPGIKGVSQSLLDKVRAKEAEKKLKTMVRSEEKCKEIQQLSKLPDVARALRMLYTAEKKSTLPLDYICEKLVKCCTGIMSEVIVEEHVSLLVKTVPSWLSNVKVKNTTYVKMNKSEEMSAVLQQLQTKRAKAETSD